MPKFDWPKSGQLIDGVPLPTGAGLTITVQGANARGCQNGGSFVTINRPAGEGVVVVRALTCTLLFDTAVSSISLPVGAVDPNAPQTTASLDLVARDAAGGVLASVGGSRTTRDTAVSPFLVPMTCAPAGGGIRSVELTARASAGQPAPDRMVLGSLDFTLAAAMAAGAGGGPGAGIPAGAKRRPPNKTARKAGKKVPKKKP